MSTFFFRQPLVYRDGSYIMHPNNQQRKHHAMHLSSSRIFLQSAARDFKRTGAVVPSSKALAHSMISELALHYRQPAAVLEVGGGTGSITQRIVHCLSSGDRLDVFEIDRKFASLIKQRLRQDETFQRLRTGVHVHNKPIEWIERRPQYDFVISCLPFTNFEPQSVREIFEIYRSVLKPGGICSFYEYIFIRKAAQIISGNSVERERVAGVSDVVLEYTARYCYKHDVVIRNLPPAMVYHIRFARS